MTPDSGALRLRWDGWARRAIAVLLLQLLAGAVAVTLMAQPNAVEQARSDQLQSDRATALELRMAAVENLHIAERLAISDEDHARSVRVELLMYGMLFTLAGNLIVFLVFGLKGRKP